MALGTDWMPSGSMNLLRELKCADSLNTNYYAKHFSDGDLWRMVTYNAAWAAGASDMIGALCVAVMVTLPLQRPGTHVVSLHVW